MIISSTQNMSGDADPNKKFPAPCEKEIRKTMRGSSGNNSQCLRTIKFTGDGSQVTHAQNLPF